MNTPTLLVKDPGLAFLYSEVDKILGGANFTLTIEIEKHNEDPAVPQYVLFIEDLEERFGPFPDPVVFLEALRSWYTANPIVYEEEKEVEEPVLTKDERLQLLKEVAHADV